MRRRAAGAGAAAGLEVAMHTAVEPDAEHDDALGGRGAGCTSV